MEEELIDSDEEFNKNILLTLLPQNHQQQQQNQEPNNSKDLDLQQNHYIKSIDKTLTTRQLPSQGLSFQLWPAASSLLSLLDSSPTLLLNKFNNTDIKKLKIIELGSGTGLAGMAAAAILGADVTLTDLPHVLPNLQHNADINGDVIKSRGGSVTVRELAWGSEEDMGKLRNACGRFDMVIASDVVYHVELFDGLIKSLKCLLFKGNEDACFVMGHLRRWKKKDAVFFNRVRKFFDMEILFRDEALDGSRIGVVVYRFTVKKGR